MFLLLLLQLSNQVKGKLIVFNNESSHSWLTNPRLNKEQTQAFLYLINYWSNTLGTSGMPGRRDQDGKEIKNNTKQSSVTDLIYFFAIVDVKNTLYKLLNSNAWICTKNCFFVLYTCSFFSELTPGYIKIYLVCLLGAGCGWNTWPPVGTDFSSTIDLSLPMSVTFRSPTDRITVCFVVPGWRTFPVLNSRIKMLCITFYFGLLWWISWSVPEPRGVQNDERAKPRKRINYFEIFSVSEKMTKWIWK